MIFKGKILRDENTLEECKIEDATTVHLVKGKGKTASEPTATQPAAANTGAQQPNLGAMGGLGGMGGMGGMGGLGGMGGMPNMAAGGGMSGLGGMNMDPNQIN